MNQEDFNRTVATLAYRVRLGLRELPIELQAQAANAVFEKVRVMSIGDNNVYMEGAGLVRVVEDEINTDTKTTGEAEKGDEAV